MANNLHEDLTKKYVVLSKKYYKGDNSMERVFLCKGGFGCLPFTMGYAVAGTFVYDGTKTRVEGNEIERFATDEEVQEAMEEFRRRNPQLDLFPKEV
jgi:hypothetical protein